MITCLDSSILEFIHNIFKNKAFDFLFVNLTKIGNFGLIWIIFSAYFIIIKKDIKTGILILISLTLSSVIGNLFLKNIFVRPRPLAPENMVNLIDTPKSFSFPSGHTMSSFSAAWIIFKNREKALGISAILLASMIGFSRLYLYVHFPSDVICGAIFGIATANLTIIVANKILKHKI